REGLIGVLLHRSSVTVDLSERTNLNGKDIDLLLDCLACAAGRDGTVVLVTNRRPVRIILEVSRIASLTPVCSLLDEGLENFGEGQKSPVAEPLRSSRDECKEERL